MIKVCSWCKKEISEDSGPRDGRISHGICPECREYFYPGNGNPPTFALFLDRLGVPVLVVDESVRVVAANTMACALLGKEQQKVVGRLGGEAVECAYARLPGGCGRTVHCKSCTIRLTVLDTYGTGQCHYDVPAYLDTNKPDGVGTSHVLITTVKSGEFVLLKITEMQEPGIGRDWADGGQAWSRKSGAEFRGRDRPVCAVRGGARAQHPAKA